MSRKKKSAQSVIKAISVSVIGAGSSVAFAAPTGGVPVEGGGITIGAMNNNQLVITQALKKGIINWTDFNIDAGELVTFVQNAGNDSVTLNRVLGSQVSNIQGALEANGNIFLINPNGIVFGAGSRIDVAGLLATTMSIDNDAFMKGDAWTFEKTSDALNSVSNQGTITTGQNGFVYLVAPKVDNSGYVIANVGQVKMVAADKFTVNLQGSNLINFSVSADDLTAAGSAINTGKITADTVLLQGASAQNLMSSVVNNSGIIEATELTMAGVDIVQAGIIKGVDTAAATTATLTAGKTITTAGDSSTRANTLNLSVSAEGASIGSEEAALQVDADVLNASAASGNVLVTDVSGGVALKNIQAGSPDAGGNVVITAHGGSITSADSSQVNVSGYSANFVADGSVGSSGADLQTRVGVLSASTQNGGINLNNEGSVILGDIVAREQIIVGGQAVSSTAVDTAGTIKLSNGATGTKSVAVRSTGDVILTGTVSATDALTVRSNTGSVLAAQAGTQLIGRTVDLQAGKEVGNADQALSTQSNTVSATAQDGGVYLTESNGLTVGSISAAGTDNDVVLNATSGDIKVGSITANGGSVSLTAGSGAITDNNGDATNVSAADLTLSSKNAIGTASNALETEVDTITAGTSAAQAGVFLSNLKALTKLSVTNPNGDANVAFSGGALIYNRNLSALSLTRDQALDIAFSNTASGFKLGGIDAGSEKSVSLYAAGDITQGSGSIVAKEVSLESSGNIGSVDAALQTATNDLTLSSRNGFANVANSSSDLALTATANATNGAVKLSQSGNLVIDTVNAKTSVELSAGGAITAATDAVGTNISAGSLKLSGASIGTGSQALTSQVTGGAVNLTATGGDINYSNIGAISLLDVLASGKIAFQNSGDAVVDQVKAGGTVNFKVSGNVTDGNGDSANFVTSGLSAAVKSFGTTGDALEIQVDELVIDAANGGIYARQSNGNLLSLVQATSGGTGSDIQIAAGGDIALGNVDAGGNNVKLSAAGSIEDARTDKSKANVVARSLDINAPGGVGQHGGLDLDVSFLSAAGGTNGVTATNAGAVAVNSSSLVGKGASAISIVATAITVLDNSGGTITMDGGTLTLTATAGNIVFLNQNDTIYLPGGGSITLTALSKADSTVPGYDGVIIAGNLKTDGGNITLQAQSNITIGMLNAQGNSSTAGNVTVASAGGVILDGNGSAQNIRGNNVSLTANTPSEHDAELTRDTAIAEYSARDAEAAAKLLQLNILIQELKNYEALVSDAAVQNSMADLYQRVAELNANDQAARVDSMSGFYDGLNTALSVATVVRNAAAVIAGAAQAIPFSGDAGADAAFAVVDLAMSTAQTALDLYDLTTLSPAQDRLDELNNYLDQATSNLYAAATNLATTTAIRDTTATSKAAADLAVFKANTARDAALQVRKQAVAAYDLDQQIDSSADKPLGITANRLDINGGNTIDSSLYLNSTGNLGLGDISVASGEKIVAEADNNIGVVGNVNSDISISLQAGAAILGQGGTLATPDLKMVANNGIGANQAVNTKTDRVAADAGNNGVAITNANGGALLTIGTQGAVKGITGAGDISVTTDGSLQIDQLVKDSTHTHTVSLTSGGSIIDGNTVERNVQGGTLVATAAGSVDLDTETDTLDVQITDAGNITLREANAVTARNLKTVNGNIDLNAGGAVVVGSLDAGTGRIDLTADGAVEDDQNNGTLIVADSLNIKAAGSVGAAGTDANRHLDTQVNTVNVTASGEVNLAEAGDLNVGTFETDHGDVTVTTGGSLNLGTLSTDTVDSTVTLVAGGQITNAKDDDNSNIEAASLALSSANGIGADKALNVKVANLEAHADTGSIKVRDLDGDLVIGGVTPNLGNAAIVGVNTNGGNVQIGTAGNLTVDEAMVNADTGSIALSAGENVQQNVDLLTANGDISVAAGGDIDMLVGTQALSQGTGNVSYSADGNASLQQVTTNSGNIDLGAGGDLTQNALVQTGEGDINAQAGGDLSTLADTTITGTGNIDYSAGGNASLQQVITGSGNIDLASGGNLTQHALLQTGKGDINVQAGGDLTTLANTAVAGSGNISYLSDEGNVSLQQLTTGGGNIALEAALGDLTQHALVQTGAGNVTAKAGRDLLMDRGLQTAALGAGDVVYTAGNNANLENLSTASGNITLTAEAGNLTQNGMVHSGEGDIATTAGGSIELNGETSTVKGNVALIAKAGDLIQNVLVDSGEGNISTTAGNDVVLNATTHTGKGNVSLNAERNLIQNAVVQSGEGNIIATAGNNVVLNGETSTVKGNVDLDAAKDLTQNALVQSGEGTITAKAGGDLLMTSSGSTTATRGNVSYSAAGDVTMRNVSVGTGDVTLAAQGNLVQNGNVAVREGQVSADAGDDLSMSVGALTDVAAKGDVAYSAAGDLLIDQIRTANGNVSLSAKQGDIQVQGAAGSNVSAKQLTATAAGSIGTNDALRSSVDALVANAGEGSIVVDEADGIILSQVAASNGSVSLSAGDIAINQLQGDSINLLSSGKVETLGGGLVKGGSLSVAAETGVDLHTAVDSATVGISDTGDLILAEDDGITLTRLVTADGDTTVTAGGDIGVNTVDAGSSNVSLTSTGGAIVTQKPSIIRRLFARIAQVTGISGDHVELNAASGLGNGEQGALQLNVDTIDASTTAGNVDLVQSRAVTLEQVSSGNGDVQVAVSDGDAVVRKVSGSGAVSLSVNNGELLDDGDSNTVIEGKDLNLVASNGIGANGALQTRANTLNAQVIDSGDVAIDEADGLNSLTINSADGDVAVSSARGNLSIDVINADGHSVNLQAGAGAIRDVSNDNVSDVNADRIDMVAANGVGEANNAFDVNVHGLAANGGNGGVRLNSASTDMLTLSATSGEALKASKGDIVLTTAGDLNVDSGVKHSGGGNISLSGANIAQNADLTTSGSGNVVVNGSGVVNMAAGSTTRTDTGTVSYKAGESVSVASIQTSNKAAGGKVIFEAPMVLDKLPGVTNVKAWEVSLTAENGTSGLIKELMGDVNDSSHVQLSSRVIGGSLAESRRFMEALLQPALANVTGPQQVLDEGLLNAEQISPFHGFVEGEDGVMTYGK